MALSCSKKKMSALFRGITNVYENPDYCYVEMLEKDNKVLKYNQGEKSMRFPLTVYADLESLLEKMDT